MPKPALRVQEPYRNPLEKDVAAQLKAAGVDFVYEGDRVPFLVPQRTAKYLPDFRVGNIIIEAKGYFGKGARQRQKLCFIKESNPELDIRLLFERPDNKIYKTSNTTYGKWADDHGFKWANKKQGVPAAWIDDMKKEMERCERKTSK